MLETLVDRQDHQFAGAAQPAVHENARQIALGAGIVALVIGQDLANALGNFHISEPSLLSVLTLISAGREPFQSPCRKPVFFLVFKARCRSK